ncbi:hypothetical protein TIFTF001_018384 [Ficus carica]|uniref:Uncharacterized protein n=1 Tax=Ficus carica TaxID=3494 RepID=A0AA88AAZ8_FICCA|nr:hypothetical protein TIFTF001_018384 [Ficus carica]
MLGGRGVEGAPGKLGDRGAGWVPAGEGRGREEKREKGEERERGVAGGQPAGAGDGGGGAGGGSPASGVGHRRPSPVTEKILGGKGNVR